MTTRMDLGVTAVMLPEIDFDEQIALCASAGVRFYQFRPRLIPPDQRSAPWSNWGNHRFDLTPDLLLREGGSLRRRLERAGLAPWGTVPYVSIDSPDDEILLNLRGAAEAGAGRMRISPSAVPARPFDYGALLERMGERFSAIIERMARPLGITLILETHRGSIVTSPGLARALVGRFSPRDMGVIFDIANFSSEGAVQPVLAVSALREHIDCVHVGGQRRVEDGVDALGCRRVAPRFCGLDEGDLHIPSWIGALADADIAPPLIIEDYTPGIPGPDKLRRAAGLLHAILDGLDAEPARDAAEATR